MSGHVTYDNANPLQRAIRSFAASGPGSWLFVRTLHHIDRPVFRATRGRHTLANLLSGIPVVMLTTTGARSGLPRTVPVLGLPTPNGLAVIASNFGQERHPSWYYNLLASPDGEVTVDGETHEPYERITVDIPPDFIGPVQGALADRKGRLEQIGRASCRERG